MDPPELPSIIVTGASGFIGRHLLEEACSRYRIHAMARRSRREAGVAPHKNIDWIIVDLTDRRSLTREIDRIIEQGGVEFVIHLAGYYDFSGKDHPEYEASNVVTTRNMLEETRRLKIRRFLFTSSVVVTRFLEHEGPVTESSPADAPFPYGRTKARAEQLVREAAADFPCTTLRLAAVFSDWCEYGPLYMLLSNWFSSRWTARIIAGRGETAIPYFHVGCVVRTILAILDGTDRLPRHGVLIGSGQESISHRRLYDLATRFYFGRTRPPIFVPKSWIACGIALRDLAGRLRRQRPFERLWMVPYIDRCLRVDPSHTRQVLPIQLRPRLGLDRRLPFIIENLKSYPVEFRARNRRALKRDTRRPNLIVSEILRAEREGLVDEIFAHLTDPESRRSFPHYQAMKPDKLRWYVQLIYELLISSVRSGDRQPILSHARYIASTRREEGFPLQEIQLALETSAEIIVARLLELDDPALDEAFLNDSIRLAMQLGVDEVADTYEAFDGFMEPGE